jgi:chromosome partitioning protein
MQVWTVANQKGGVGKTTTVASLGGLLAGRGYKTVLIDIDPHASLTSYFKYDPDRVEESVYTLFERAMEKQPLNPGSAIYPTGTDGLSMIPATMSLATLDRQSGRLGGLGLVLKDSVKLLESSYDFVIIDCPPMLGVLMINAMAACRHLIIPVQTEFLALKGLDRMLHTLKMVLKARKEPLRYSIVPTMYDRRTRASQDTLSALQKSHRESLWDGVIPVDTNFREASKAGIPPSIYQRDSRGVLAYDEFLDEMLAKGDRSEAGLEVVA